MPEVSIWQGSSLSICESLFPGLSCLRTASGNINPGVQAWLTCWLKDALQTAHKARGHVINSLTDTEGAISGILEVKEFWKELKLDIMALTMKKVTALTKQLGKCTTALSWTMRKVDEDLLKTNELAKSAPEADMAARWEKLSDAAKKMKWAGWAYGQVEAFVNAPRTPDKHREIDLSSLSNETLKTASTHGFILHC